MKSHAKRLALPRTWAVARKSGTFIVRPNPGGHPRAYSLSIATFLREYAHLASTLKEARQLLNAGKVSVSGRVRKDYQYPVGLFDVVSIGETHLRLVLDVHGRLITVTADHPERTIMRVTAKSMVEDKVQLNCAGGRNLLIAKDNASVAKNYKVGDALLVTLPSQDVIDHFPFEKGVVVFLTGGSHPGQVGTVEQIKGRNVVFKLPSGEIFATMRRFAIPVGKTEPAITVTAKKN
ncbi:hypothetical protein AUJ68_01140 [Candidatus Woesearchaeota archaeon CG1_02_57_44]|nr:MAG: hypothetical protein AUJ68_01140 [Candidatus Woesearchaeota archaeon CG1_02_57_44]PIN69231.1 MAG: hypothetical protein COV94_03135 [Candidatus Woesearchaeota archaeon CG11_big_fil_rev_8_21_14_0_20_57_5]